MRKKNTKREDDLIFPVSGNRVDLDKYRKELNLDLNFLKKQVTDLNKSSKKMQQDIHWLKKYVEEDNEPLQ